MRFKSKVDAWLRVMTYFFVFLQVYFIYLLIVDFNSGIVITNIIFLLINGLSLSIYYLTYYEIKDEVLHIKSGIFYKKQIPIKDIKGITYTSNPLSSAALSTKRIAIYYDNHKSPKLSFEFISPEDKELFSNEVLKINSEVKVNLENK